MHYTDLLNPPAVDFGPIFDLVWSRHIRPAVAVAQSLGWLDIWLENPMGMEEAAQTFGVSIRGAEAIMAVLAASGYLSRDAEGVYHPTAITREYLVDSSPFYWGPVIPFDNSAVEDLKQAVTQGEPIKAIAVQLGSQEDETLENFISGMHRLTLPAGIQLAKHPVFQGIKRVLDIAGGSGSLCCALAAQHQQLKATVFDLPRVSAIARANIETYGLTDRIDVQVGDMFEDCWPTGYDAILMGNIFHDWDVASCGKLASSAFQALPSGGKLLLHEMVLDETRDGPLAIACFSISMLLHERGKQYTPGEFRAMLGQAGFEQITISPSFGHYSLVSATKP